MNYYTLGIFSGIITALVVFMLSAYFSKNKNKAKDEFDERQLLMQGKANKAGMWTALIGCGVVGIAGEFGADFCPVGLAMFFIVCVSIMAYVLVAIHYDAYIGFKANTKKQMTSFVLLFIAMLLNVITSAGTNGFFKDGRMTVAWLFLAAVFMYIVLFAALFIHNRGKAAEESEEE